MLGNKENLLPFSLKLRYMIKMLIKPVILAVLALAVIIAGYFIGCRFVTKHYQEEAANIESISYKSQTDTLKLEVNKLESEITEIEKNIRNSRNQVFSLSEQFKSNIEVQEVIDYIIMSKTYGITLMMIEDEQTYENYRKQNYDNPDYVESENPENDTYQDSINNPLLFRDNNDMRIIVRGYAVDKILLADYLNSLKNCEKIETVSLNAIEETDFFDYRLSVFEVVIIPDI